MTVRLAIQKLNVQGLLDTRPGDGTFIREFDFTQYMDAVSDIIMKPEMLSDVLEFRIMIENEAARLAIQRASDQDFEELEAIYQQMSTFYYDFEQPENERMKAYIDLDYRFHYTICKLSGNSLIQLAYEAARVPVTTYLTSIAKQRRTVFHERYPEIKNANIEAMMKQSGHAALLKALRNRDKKMTKRLISMLEDYNISTEEME